jgi:DnaK suppressor protein
MTRPINQDDLQQLQHSLQARRRLLVGQRDAQLGGQSRAEHAREVLLQDGDDDTQRDAEREVDFARSDQDAVALAKVDRALQRVALGSYGLCIACGEPIPLERLRLAPEAPRCVACERLLERDLPKPAKL